MQRDIHKMEVKRNKRTLQNYTRNGISTLNKSQYSLSLQGRREGENIAWLIYC